MVSDNGRPPEEVYCHRKLQRGLIHGLTAQAAPQAHPGSLDPDFHRAATGSEIVKALAVQVDGRILVGGGFKSYDGQPRDGLARLNPDGTLDPTFTPHFGDSSPGTLVMSILVQSDGKILVGGDFSQVNGAARTRIARLNSDGSIDPSFASGLTIGSRFMWFGSGLTIGFVDQLALQSTGQLLISGRFDSVNGLSITNLARLHPDGTLDTNFVPSLDFDAPAQQLIVQPDDRILLAGQYGVGTKPLSTIERLLPDGQLDPTFHLVLPPGNTNPVSNIALQPDGKIIALGSLTLGTKGACKNNLSQCRQYSVIA